MIMKIFALIGVITTGCTIIFLLSMWWVTRGDNEDSEYAKP